MSKHIKVLALSFLFPNRAKPNHGIFVLNRLKALSEYVDIKVINPIPWFPLQAMFERYSHLRNIPKREIIGGLEVFHPRFLSIPKYMKAGEGDHYLKAIRPIVREIHKNYKFDLIDMHWTFPDLPAGLAISKEYRKKTVLTLRGMEAFHEQDRDQRHRIVVEGIKSVDSVIALSEELKRHGDSLSGDSDKSTVIRNGVDTDEFYYLPKEECRKYLNIGDTEIVILTVGSLIHRKGIDLLIRSLAKLHTMLAHGNAKLYIVGSEGPEGDYRRQLYNLVGSLGLNERVVFVGQVANVHLISWYNACDIFCLASRGEGSPNVLIEALACGCPSVTTDVGSAKMIIESDPGKGLCVAPDSEQELIDGLKSILSVHFDRQGNAERFGQYNWDWCARQVLPIYEHLVAEKSSNRVSNCSGSAEY